MTDERPATYEEAYRDGNDGTVANVVPFTTTRATASGQAKEDNPKPKVVDAPGAPYLNARRFVNDKYRHDVRPLLVHHGGNFERWDGACWPQVEDRALRSAIYDYFHETQYWHVLKSGSELRPFNPTFRKISDLVDALKAATHLSQEITAPAWLGTRASASRAPAADGLLSLQNGLLHIPTRTLHAHSPAFYVNWALPYTYDEAATAPVRWFRFLDDIWGDDDESKESLQDWFGYLLSGITRYQKILGLLGPKRSGKGTTARVLRGLLGSHNVAGPTLSSLSTNFGLSPLIGKPVAVIADARLRSDDATIVERLLSISGEDLLTIDRKYADHWTGRLPTRFVLISNETPQLRDSSGALASRFVLLSYPKSFYGFENDRLTDELLEELPGILQWSLDGLERLLDRGRFVQPQAGLEVLAELEDLASPMSTFVRDCCTVGVGHRVAASALFKVWLGWCKDNGRDHPGTVQSFGRDLRAALPGLKLTRPRADQQRYREYEGIGIGAAPTENEVF
jgi:putative DNA primase/helicase